MQDNIHHNIWYYIKEGLYTFFCTLTVGKFLESVASYSVNLLSVFTTMAICYFAFNRLKNWVKEKSKKNTWLKDWLASHPLDDTPPPGL